MFLLKWQILTLKWLLSLSQIIYVRKCQESSGIVGVTSASLSARVIVVVLPFLHAFSKQKLIIKMSV